MREAAARTKCANNLKQLALGLHAHHEAVGAFPAGDQTYFGGDGPPFATRLVWVQPLLPYVEQGPFFDQYTAWAAANPGANLWAFPGRFTLLTVFQCPSDPGGPKRDSLPGDQQGAHGNYVACAGSQAFTTPAPGDGTNLNGMFYAKSKVRLTDVADGTSNTLLLGELLTSPDVTTHDTRGRYWNDANQGGVLFSTLYQPGPNAPPDTLQWCESIPRAPCQNVAGRNMSARSGHTGVCNFALADGSIRSIRHAVDLPTFQALGTRAGGEPLGDY